MDDSHETSVTLPDDVAAMLDDRMASGDYASPADAIRDGLSALRRIERSRERWLRGPVADSFDDYEADPENTLSANDVLIRAQRYFDGRGASGER